MDNVTHALAGMVLAETWLVWRGRKGRAPPRGLGPAAYLAAAVGNNLPDIDFAYTFITGGKLGYLLHHRGHTHTLALGPLLGLVAWLGLWRFWWRRYGFERAERVGLAALLITGPVLHVAMDGSNVYGVHPLWPLYNGWVYGDRVFVLEPWFWVATVPPLLFAVRARAGKVLLGLVALAGAGLPFLTDIVPSWLEAWIAGGMVIALLVCARCSPALRVAWGALGSLLVLAVFLVSGSRADAIARAVRTERFPAERWLDVALSPMPGNPVCWSAVIVAHAPGDVVLLRRGMFSVAPERLGAERCPSYRLAGTAQLVDVPAADEPRVSWGGQWSAPRRALLELAESCDGAALLRFARAPYVQPSGNGRIAGDLRFDRSPALDFAEMELPVRPGRCPRFVPPWTPPRRDLLDMPTPVD